MNHNPPFSIDARDALYFVTICSAERVGGGRPGRPPLPLLSVGGDVLGAPPLAGILEMPFMVNAKSILDAAEFYHLQGKWFVRYMLIMPDHIHAIIQVGGFRPVAPHPRSLAKTVGDFKSYLSKKLKIEFQRDFFDTRIRNEKHLVEKIEYIEANPIEWGLSDRPGEWPYFIRHW